MEQERKSFIFHKDWYEAISVLDDITRCQVYDAIMQKVFGGNDIQLSDLAQMAMRFIIPQIKRDTDKWIDTKTKRQKSGKLGGLAKQANATKCYQMLPNGSKSKQNLANLPVSVSVSVSDNVSVDNNNVILEEKEDKSSSKKKQDLDFSIVDSSFLPVVEKWLAYKKEKSQSYKPTGFKIFYKKLVELSDNNSQIAMSIIEQSMQNNYAGIFPLKEWEKEKVKQQDMFDETNKDVEYNTWIDSYTPYDGQKNQRGEVWSSKLNTWLK